MLEFAVKQTESAHAAQKEESILRNEVRICRDHINTARDKDENGLVRGRLIKTIPKFGCTGQLQQFTSAYSPRCRKYVEVKKRPELNRIYCANTNTP